MLADILTKECRSNKLIVELLRRNVFKQAMEEKNKVVLGDGEIKLMNKSVKGK